MVEIVDILCSDVFNLTILACLELCLYGITELASATFQSWTLSAPLWSIYTILMWVAYTKMLDRLEHSHWTRVAETLCSD